MLCCQVQDYPQVQEFPQVEDCNVHVLCQVQESLQVQKCHVQGFSQVQYLFCFLCHLSLGLVGSHHHLCAKGNFLEIGNFQGK